MATSKDISNQSFANGQKGVDTEDDEKTPLIINCREDIKKITKIQVALCVCILLTELCERLTFYGVAANLVPYCEDVLNLQTPVPSQVALAFSGSCFFLPILGGWVADTYLGRFNTIYGSSLIYFVGCSLLATSTYDYGKHGLTMSLSSREVFLAISLVLIALGTGGIKANVSPFGADQIRSAGEAAVARFFNWFYWFIQIGGFLSYTVVVYVQQEVAFFYGYLIVVLSMFLAILIFLAGRNQYLSEPPEGSAVSRTIKIIWHGIKIKCSRNKRHVDGTWLDQTKFTGDENFSESEVEDVRTLIPIFPVFLTFILYWTIFGQCGTSYLRQGTHMKLRFGSFSFPAASLTVFENGTLIILIPILDGAVYPLLRYCGVKITPLKKIGVGMLFAAASVGVAGVIEIERKNFIKEHGIFYQAPFDKPTNASSMVILYQAPQFILMGVSEILVSITGLEFAYSQSPKRLRGVVMGLCLAMIGIGYYLADALVTIVTSLAADWYPKPKKLNTGSLEKYFFLIMGFMLLNFFLFLAIAVRYKYVARENDDKHQELNDTGPQQNN